MTQGEEEARRRVAELEAQLELARVENGQLKEENRRLRERVEDAADERWERDLADASV